MTCIKEVPLLRRQCLHVQWRMRTQAVYQRVWLQQSLRGQNHYDILHRQVLHNREEGSHRYILVLLNGEHYAPNNRVEKRLQPFLSLKVTRIAHKTLLINYLCIITCSLAVRPCKLFDTKNVDIRQFLTPFLTI